MFSSSILIRVTSKGTVTDPGGPKKSTPAGTSRPKARNLSGWAIGSSTLWRSSSLTSARAPTSPADKIS
jgi:hypothetical protein